MAVVIFDPSAFRLAFPDFGSLASYPDAKLQRYFDMATAYINNRSGGCYGGGWKLNQLTIGLNLMTAHLLTIANIIAGGNNTGVLTQATIDKVSVTIEPPPVPNQWQYWLQSTPYGAELLALLQVLSAGGYYITTGAPGRAGFQYGIGY